MNQSRIAFHLSLWPFVLFVSFLGVLYIILIGAAVSPAPSGGTFREAIVIFIILAVRSPAMAAPILSSLIGVIMGFAIKGSGVDRRPMKTATRAAIFGLAGLAVYAYLLFGTTGFGA